jgi:hypothetical protein
MHTMKCTQASSFSKEKSSIGRTSQAFSRNVAAWNAGEFIP